MLLIGAGEVGAKHIAALDGTPGVKLAGVADPAPRARVPAGIPVFVSWRSALAALRPDLVVVAVPPGAALTAAREAAMAGAAVLVEKPATVNPASLASCAGDKRIFVAFQPHFAPGLAELLTGRPAIVRAEVTLAVRRDPAYFRGWRRMYTSAGGVLHQQAIHGLALALRLLPGDVETIDATVTHRRGLAETEDEVTAEIALTGGLTIQIDARVDYHGSPRHEVVLQLADGRPLSVCGRNLEAGLGDRSTAPTHENLRRLMYAALFDADHAFHPCLFPLSALRRPLEVIDRVYREAHVVRIADSSAA